MSLKAVVRPRDVNEQNCLTDTASGFGRTEEEGLRCPSLRLSFIFAAFVYDWTATFSKHEQTQVEIDRLPILPIWNLNESDTLMSDIFQLPTFTGETLLLDLPVAGEGQTSAEGLFEDVCKALTAELEIRLRRDKHWKGWIEDAGYEVLGRLVAYGHAQLLEERISRLDRSFLRGPDDNAFHRGLVALIAHRPHLIGKEDRKRFGNRCWYAHRHYIPPCFLKGFLREVWSKNIDEKVARGHIEPKFEQWVYFERAKDDRPHLRGSYQAEMEDKVTKARLIIGLLTNDTEVTNRHLRDWDYDDE